MPNLLPLICIHDGEYSICISSKLFGHIKKTNYNIKKFKKFYNVREVKINDINVYLNGVIDDFIILIITQKLILKREIANHIKAIVTCVGMLIVQLSGIKYKDVDHLMFYNICCKFSLSLLYYSYGIKLKELYKKLDKEIDNK